MDRRISVIGLGYAGLPVGTTFARSGPPVVTFDIDARRIGELRKGHDRTGEVAPAALNPAQNVRSWQDSVEKRGSSTARRKIRIGLVILVNHCCALGRARESSLRRRGAKIVFQSIGRKADMTRTCCHFLCPEAFPLLAGGRAPSARSDET